MYIMYWYKFKLSRSKNRYGYADKYLTMIQDDGVETKIKKRNRPKERWTEGIVQDLKKLELVNWSKQSIKEEENNDGDKNSWRV